jgi:hypothetical protein
MMACVILRNMIIENERALNLKFFYDNAASCVKQTRNHNHIEALLETYQEIEDSCTYT